MKRLLLLAALAASPALGQQAVVSSSVKTFDNGTTAPAQADINGNLKVAIAATGASSTQVQGTTASGGTPADNPVPAGCTAATAQNATTAGQRSNVLCSSGMLVAALTSTSIVNTTSADGSALTVGFVGNPTNFSAGMGLGTVSFVWNGTTTAVQRGDTNGTYVNTGLGQWTYSSGTTGILSNTTTAVTFKAAAGASVRNFVDSCQISTTAFTTSVPIAIRDGAGGSVIWAANVPTQGFLTPLTIVFSTPLRGTANTLLEVVTTTANTTGSAMVNCQGHTGT